MDSCSWIFLLLLTSSPSKKSLEGRTLGSAGLVAGAKQQTAPNSLKRKCKVAPIPKRAAGGVLSLYRCQKHLRANLSIALYGEAHCFCTPLGNWLLVPSSKQLQII